MGYNPHKKFNKIIFNAPKDNRSIDQLARLLVFLFIYTSATRLERYAEMEKVKNEQPTVEVFENKIELFIDYFCEEKKIKDLRKESQAVWNACLIYVQKNVFSDRKKLKSTTLIDSNSGAIKTNYNAYDYELLNDICDIYIYMCMLYEKEVSVVGYSLLTGITQDMLYKWYDGVIKSSKVSQEIPKKLIRFREESLSDKLVTGARNPVGVIAVLNRQFGWQSPYTSDSNRQVQPLSVNELPKLGGASSDLSLTDGQTEEKTGINSVIDVVEEPSSLDAQGV